MQRGGGMRDGGFGDRGRGRAGFDGGSGPSSRGRGGLEGLTLRDGWTDSAEGPNRKKLRKEQRKTEKEKQKQARIQFNSSRAVVNREKQDQRAVARGERIVQQLEKRTSRPSATQKSEATLSPAPLERPRVRISIPADLIDESQQVLLKAPRAEAPEAVVSAPTPRIAVPPKPAYVLPQKRKASAELENVVRRICNKLTEGNTSAMSTELSRLFDVEGHPRSDVIEAFCTAMRASVLEHTALTSTVVLGYVGVIRALQLQFTTAATGRIYEFLVTEAAAALDNSQSVVAKNVGMVLAHMLLLHCTTHVLTTSFIAKCMESGSVEGIQAAMDTVRAAGDRLRRDCPGELNALVQAADVVLERRKSEPGFPRVRMSVFIDVMRSIASGKSKTSTGSGAVGELDVEGYESVLAQLTEHFAALEGAKANKRNIKSNLTSLQVMQVDFDMCSQQPKPARWWSQSAIPTSQTVSQSLAAKKHRAEVTNTDAEEEEEEDLDEDEAAQDDEEAAEEEAEPERDESDEARDKRTAKQQRAVDIAMSGLRINTELRRRIFSAIAASSDDADCFHRVMQLGVATGNNMHDVASVLLQCAVQDKTVNIFYAKVLQRLCSAQKKFRIVLQFALWDRFKAIQQQDVDVCGFINLAAAISFFISERVFSLPLLRGLDVDQGISKKVGLFLRVLFLRLILDLDQKQLADFCFGIDTAKKASRNDDDDDESNPFGDVNTKFSDVVSKSKTGMRKALLKFFTAYFVDEMEAAAWMPHLIDVVGADLNLTDGSTIESIPHKIATAKRALRDGT